MACVGDNGDNGGIDNIDIREGFKLEYLKRENEILKEMDKLKAEYLKKMKRKK